MPLSVSAKMWDFEEKETPRRQYVKRVDQVFVDAGQCSEIVLFTATDRGYFCFPPKICDWYPRRIYHESLFEEFLSGVFLFFRCFFSVDTLYGGYLARLTEIGGYILELDKIFGESINQSVLLNVFLCFS